jgi:hypothetical protein
MFRHKALVRFIAIFVAAFICMNAGGAMCVAYCQGFAKAAETEHCPLQKASHHCNKAKTEGDPSSESIGSHFDDCCPMTVSFFASPVEKTFSSFEAAAESLMPRTEYSHPVIGPVRPLTATRRYFGPPPLDRRIDRLKHCIIRI